jgi:hypothetical protein
MYFVGVSSILKHLGILTPTTKVSGSSGGSVAAAMSCGNVPTREFLAAAKILANTCSPQLALNCRGTLDGAVRLGLLVALPDDVHTACQGRLWVSVTSARSNLLPDVERKATTFSNRTALLQALAASSYIPGISLPSPANTRVTGIGAAYDGAFTNPLPVPPCESWCCWPEACLTSARQPLQPCSQPHDSPRMSWQSCAGLAIA